MAEPSKTLRQVMVVSIQSLTVTRATIEGTDGVTLGEVLMVAAGLLPGEKVELLNTTTGARLSTVVRASPSTTGEVEVTGPAAHFVSVGDRIAMCAWGWMKEKAAARHQPRVVHVDDKNRVEPSRGSRGGGTVSVSSEAPPSERPRVRRGG